MAFLRFDSARTLCYNPDTRELKRSTYSCLTAKSVFLSLKPGLDGHDRGAKSSPAAWRDAGFEVIYTGIRQTPEMIAEAALQEDVDVVGLSILSGADMRFARGSSNCCTPRAWTT